MRPSSSSAWQRTCELACGEGTLGEDASLVDVIAGEGDLGVQHGRLAGDAGLRGGREQVPGDCELPPRSGPSSCIHCRPGQMNAATEVAITQAFGRAV